jgi:hypothetical protein
MVYASALEQQLGEACEKLGMTFSKSISLRSSGITYTVKYKNRRIMHSFDAQILAAHLSILLREGYITIKSNSTQIFRSSTIFTLTKDCTHSIRYNGVTFLQEGAMLDEFDYNTGTVRMYLKEKGFCTEVVTISSIVRRKIDESNNRYVKTVCDKRSSIK